jgi:hypothetical protein
MWTAWRAGASPFNVALGALAWAAAALAPTAVAWSIYAGLGHGEAWLYANFYSIFDRTPDPVLEQLANLGIVFLIILPLLACAALPWFRRDKSVLHRFLHLWTLAALCGVLAIGPYFDHYALPLIPPVATCAAGFWSDHRRFALTFIALAFVAGQAVLIGKPAMRGTPTQIEAIARVIGAGSGCLHVYSGTTMLYPMTGRCAVTRWVFPSHLSRIRERGATGVDQEAEIDRILRVAPEWVVMRAPYDGERTEMRNRMLKGVEAGYTRVAVMPLGNDHYALWRRVTPSATTER